MSSAIAGLIGAAIGALAGVAGAVISQRMQARATQERTLQSKKEEAYSSTLRYLLRVQNRRQGISAEFGTYITTEGIRDLFDDMVEAQFWVSALTIYCAKDQRETVKQVSGALNKTVADFVSGEGMKRAAEEIAAVIDKAEGDEVFLQEGEKVRAHSFPFSSWYETILACAREDIGETFMR